MSSNVKTRSSSFPRAPLWIAALLVVASLTVSGYRSWVNPAAPLVLADSPVETSRALRFEDAANGQVIVIDDATDSAIDYLDVGTNGFLRSTMRGLARARAAAFIGSDIPFIVERRVNGQVLLIDPATDRFIDLRAFGPDNSVVFTRYLDEPVNSNVFNKEASL